MRALLLALFLIQAPVSDGDYRIGPEDVVEVVVFGQPELSGSSQVSGAGHITLPRIGSIAAVGLDARSLGKRVEDALREKILVDPHVTVSVKQIAVPQVIAVTGSVRNVGVYQVRRGQALLEIITKAGGLTDAAGPLIQITRQVGTGQDQTSQVLLVDTEDLVDKGKPEANVILQSGDLINVPRGFPISVTGEVLKPGDLMVRFGKNATVRDVIQQSGGLTERAGGVIRIARSGANANGPSVAPEIVLVSTDDLLDKGKPEANVIVQAGDTVNVPRGVPISVTGQVARAGDLPIRFGRSTTVRDVIQQAGGLTEHAGSVIRIARLSAERSDTKPASPEIVVINVEDLIEKMKPEANVPVYPGDVVNVPRGLPIVSVGELAKPAEFELRNGKGMSLRDVVLKSGGFTKDADIKQCVVIRIHEDGAADYMVMNLEKIMDPAFPNQTLLPNDILYVPAKPNTKNKVLSTTLTVAVSAATQRLIFFGR
jgi:polysaccharide export outer membrane protein